MLAAGFLYERLIFYFSVQVSFLNCPVSLARMMQKDEYRHYRIAFVFTIFLMVIVSVFLLIDGKQKASLVINNFNSPLFDSAFRWFTYLGDGIMWVPLALYVLFFKRDFFIAVAAGIILSTFFTQFLKHEVFPNDLRPIALLKEQLHIIKGLEINRANSFPSGHTGTAFTIALLMSFMIHRTFWTFFLPVVAFFVGYSRVYLGQHFATDVLAGMAVGLISSLLSLWVYGAFIKRKERVATESAKNT